MKYFFLLSLFLIASQTAISQTQLSKSKIIERLNQENEFIVNAELNSDLEKRLSVFGDNPICMPDHQVSMMGDEDLEHYFGTIFERRTLSKYDRTISDIFLLQDRCIEIGTYEKSGIYNQNNTPFTHKGKYMNLWKIDVKGELKLDIECWNYDNAVELVDPLLVALPTSGESTSYEVESSLTDQQIDGMEDAKILMSKGVNERDGHIRASIYHDDGVFMPHDQPMMVGKEEILAHMIDYNSGNVTIDSLAGGSQWAENLGEYILESSFYYVEWSMDEYSGVGRGKGLRLWRRTEDGKQKILLNIALRDTDIAE